MSDPGLSTAEYEFRRKCTVFIFNRGLTYKLPLKKIYRHPESRLARDCNEAGVHPTLNLIELHYQRNSQILEAVIDFYQNDRLHFPTHLCWQTFEEELAFWDISPDLLDRCCRQTYLKAGEVRRTTDDIKTDWEAHMYIKLQDLACLHKLNFSPSKKIWLFLECPESSRGAKVMICQYT